MAASLLSLLAVLLYHVNAAYYQYETEPSYWHNLAFDELTAAPKELPKGVAKNVIFFLGDGMGIPTVTAARILAGQMAGNSGEENKLSFDKFPYTGLSRTYNVDRQTTDSAASGTAYLTGVKTNQGLLGLSGKAQRLNCSSAQDAHVDSILRWSISAGKSTGVLTTTRITHATPGASYSHSADRDWEGDRNIPAAQKHCEDIALQLITRNNDINVIMGGGRAYFLPTGFNDPDPDPTFNAARYNRADGRNLVQEWEAIMTQRNASYQYVYNKPGLDRVDPLTTDYLLGLFTQSHMSYELDRNPAKEPSLAEMTEKAIKILEKNSKGYFLFIEGGKIDHGHHESRPAHALHETVAFADAIDVANRLTNKSETLIVVTADHSHVMSLAGYASRGNPILGLSDEDNHQPTKANDGKPYTTILYADGPGFHSPRQIVTGIDTADKAYISQSAVPLYSETHGGEDVGIYAQGPQSFLYSGVHEQNYIPIVMAYASCVGPFAEGLKQCAKYEK
ncbi:alkaline phosphatase [Biomphalaria glabrata]|nr:alkaline phosphatase-like [Biomphalaria glabrata]